MVFAVWYHAKLLPVCVSRMLCSFELFMFAIVAHSNKVKTGSLTVTDEVTDIQGPDRLSDSVRLKKRLFEGQPLLLQTLVI